MAKTEDKNSLPDDVESSENTLFYGNISEAINYYNTAYEYLDAIQSYQSVRLIVLETWLLLDFTVRQLILAGLGLSKYENDELNLKSNLLPRNFRGCLNLLTKLRDYNKQLPHKPEEYPFLGSLDYVSYLFENDEEATKKVVKLTDEYCKINSIPKPGTINENDYRFVKKDWIDVAEQIDDNWQKKAKRINTVRNYAAHSYSDKKIASKLGYHGDSIITQTRKHCLNMFDDLLGIKPKENA